MIKMRLMNTFASMYLDSGEVAIGIHILSCSTPRAQNLTVLQNSNLLRGTSVRQEYRNRKIVFISVLVNALKRLTHTQVNYLVVYSLIEPHIVIVWLFSWRQRIP